MFYFQLKHCETNSQTYLNVFFTNRCFEFKDYELSVASHLNSQVQVIHYKNKYIDKNHNIYIDNTSPYFKKPKSFASFCETNNILGYVPFQHSITLIWRTAIKRTRVYTVTLFYKYSFERNAPVPVCTRTKDMSTCTLFQYIRELVHYVQRNTYKTK